MKRMTSLVLTALLLWGLTVPALSASFPDVAADHWAAAEIASAASAGLFQGDESGRFRPSDTLTRAAFVTVLCRMFGWAAVSPASPAYDDCAPGAWYYSAVETAAAHGVGDGGAAFRPDAPITRGELAVMLVQALGYDSLAAEAVEAGMASPFADAAVDGANGGYLLTAYQIGLTNGVPEGDRLLFKPDDTATRAEAAAMVMRVYRRYTSKLGWVHGFYAFSSYSQLSLAGELDAVSLGWARLGAGGDGTPAVISDASGGNEWVRPAGYEEVTGHLADRGVPCSLNVYADNYADQWLSGVLADPGQRAAAVAALADAAAGYAGLTIDFEALRAPQKADFNAFLTQLRAALPSDKTLFVCVQPDDWFDGYDYRAIGEIADRVIVMAHDYDWTAPDYYVGTDRTDNPPAALPDVYRTLAAVTDPAAGVADPAKVILAVSIDSVALPVDENGLLTSTQLAHPAPATLITRLRQPDAVLDWSAEYATARVTYSTEDGGRWLVWYEDARSVAAKAELARMFGIGGLSLWRLGNIPAYDDAGLNYHVWDAVTAQW